MIAYIKQLLLKQIHSILGNIDMDSTKPSSKRGRPTKKKSTKSTH